MSRSLRFNWLSRRARRNPTPSHLPPHRRSLRFELLEDRRLLAVFTVDNLNDSGEGSLRDAIEQANSDVVADIINFGPLFNAPQTITIASQLPTITHALTITGPGANRLTIDAGHGGWRIFNVDNGNSSTQIDVAISGLALTGGDAGVGGAIDNAENLTISNSWIYNNAALFGGGIVNSGTLTVEGSTISGNTATMGGGGINSSGIAVIRNSTISGNNAGSANGGGIINYAPPGSPASLTIENSTITNNTANVGEALHSFGSGAPTATISNSILNGSVLKSGTLTGNNNLFSGADPGITGTANQFDANPSLSPLADNGGPTRTHALLAGSPAINAGGTTALTSDQRGAPFQRVAGGAVDIGAYEQQTLSLQVDLIVDEDDGDYMSGNLSLREAIALANINPGADTIMFAPGLSGQTIVLTGGQLLLTDAVTIDAAPLAENVTINANLQSRIFDITDFGGNVTLAGLTLTGGRTAANFVHGGAIRSATSGLLELRESTVDGNHTTGANSRGGGIFAFGAVTLTQSTVSGNRTAANFSHGGGVHSYGAVTLTQSTVSGNSTTGLFANGGGIYAGGAVTLSQSTVSGNSTAGVVAQGGGVYARSAVTLSQSTVSGNSATGDGAQGGGVFQRNNTNNYSLSIRGSIIAGNMAAGGSPNLNADPESLAVANSVSYSLIGDNSGSGVTTETGIGNVLNAAPLLGPLADNGGRTKTHALLAGSPAIDKGNPVFVGPPNSDQRGAPFVRVFDGDGLGGARIDIGAYERQTLDPVWFVVTTALDELDYSNADVSLREAISFANSSVGPDAITFAPGLSGQTIVLGGTELAITDGVTIDATALAANLTIDAQQQSRIFLVDDGNAFNQIEVTISGLTLIGGVATGAGDAGRGGAIFNRELLALAHSTVSGNSAAINGGGIYNSGDLHVSTSTLSGNIAVYGGGVTNFGDLTITASTLANNSATFNGGAVDNVGTVTIANSTLSGNSAGSAAGGVSSYAFASTTATVTISNSTLAGNAANSSSPDKSLSSFGAGALNVSVFNTILTGSVFGPLTGDYNLFSAAAANVGIPAAHNLFNANPLLGPLADNGGPTQTHALLPGSPAIDAGSRSFVNVARGGVATQSSTLSPYVAGNAIDGDYSATSGAGQNISLTDVNDVNPQWSVVLSADQLLTQIVLNNRGFRPSRLRDITVRIFNSSGTEVYTSQLLNPENILVLQRRVDIAEIG